METAEVNYLQCLDDIVEAWNALDPRNVEEMVYAQEGDARAAVSLWLGLYRAEVLAFYERSKEPSAATTSATPK